VSKVNIIVLIYDELKKQMKRSGEETSARTANSPTGTRKHRYRSVSLPVELKQNTEYRFKSTQLEFRFGYGFLTVFVVVLRTSM
jgi:hypothetical protein